MATNVDSSNIQSMDYNILTGNLEITFLNGSTYVYENVPTEVWAALQTAPSKGSYFFKAIRNIYKGVKK